jgi:hypothetical protein
VKIVKKELGRLNEFVEKADFDQITLEVSSLNFGTLDLEQIF